MKLLITGGCGFLGSNLARTALEAGIDVSILDDLSRQGSENNLEWLKAKHNFNFTNDDIRDHTAVETLIRDIRPDAIFHLAGQVAMTTSLIDPKMDFEINALGTMNVLDCVRKHTPEAVVVYSSTNKVYGDLERYTYKEEKTRYVCAERPAGFDESEPFSPSTPYGCSKGAADICLLDHARTYGTRTVVFRHSSMYGGRQYPTYDQGWIGWFVKMAIETKEGKLRAPFTVTGNGKQVRDVLYCDDLVELYFNAVRHIDKAKGHAFNIGGGIENSLSIVELLNMLEKMLDIKMDHTFIKERDSDQKVFVSNNSKAEKLLGWSPRTDCLSGVKKTVEWIKNA